MAKRNRKKTVHHAKSAAHRRHTTKHLHIPLIGVIALGIIVVGLLYMRSTRAGAEELPSGAIELVTNGSFETDVDEDRIPDGWTWNGNRLMRQEGKICNDPAYDGSCVFVIDSDRKKPGSISQTFSVDGLQGDAITFQAAGKPTRADFEYHGFVTMHYTSGEVNTNAIQFARGKTGDFQLVSTTFTAPKAYNQIDVSLTYNQQRGNAAFDAVSLTRTPPPTPTPTP